jgi:hypothetical protein
MKRMKKLNFIPIVLSGMFVLSCNSISIEDETYEERPHFKIETKAATYFFDKAGGGLSRVIDSDGNDWINYNGDPHAVVPSGASGGYRGIPNMVYRYEDGGAGHPGFDQCISEKVDETTIRTQSKSGKWQWAWTFFDDHASLTIEKVDTDRTFWFLYEGPVAGNFNPASKYWGTDLGGPRSETPSLNHGENIVGNWQWVYFGDKKADRIFYVMQTPKDNLNDFFAYMGDTKEGNSSPDGMVVFGFSRDRGTKALENKTGVSYTIGFLERKVISSEDHEWVSEQIGEILNKE